MHNQFRRLMAVLAGSARSDLRRQVQFLKAENEILKSRLPTRLRTTPAERARLLRLGRPLGRAVNDIITIVSPRTFARWLNRRDADGRREPVKRRRGRPKTPEEIRDLILRIARETDWGVTRILGELRKLGIKVSRTTIANILREHGIEPAPKRGEGTWDGFLRMHAQTLWACDFVRRKVWTLRGLTDAFLLVFIHVSTRRVVVSPCTRNPDASWAQHQVRILAAAASPTGEPPRILLRDRDGKYGETAFDHRLRAVGITPVRLPALSPNLNAYAERFIKTLRNECLDRFIALGTGHLDHLVGEFVDYYNRQRPHSRLDQNRAPCGPSPPTMLRPPGASEVVRQDRLGGAVKHYFRKAA